MLTKITYLIFIVLLLFNKAVFAQLDLRLTSTLGITSLHPSTDLNLKIEPGNFIGIGFQADYYFLKNLGFGFGTDYYIKKSNHDVILSNYSHSYSGMDSWELDPTSREYLFTIKSNSETINELNSISYYEVPISAVYKIPYNKQVSFITRLGLKIGLPQKGTYQLEESDLYTRLYFQEWDLELFNIPAHGLYDSRTNWHPEGELSLNNEFSVFSELGIDLNISLIKLRFSGFLSYGINDMINEKHSSLVYWREEYNNILSLPQKVNMMQFGVKLGIGFIIVKKCPWEYASL